MAQAVSKADSVRESVLSKVQNLIVEADRTSPVPLSFAAEILPERKDDVYALARAGALPGIQDVTQSGRLTKRWVISDQAIADFICSQPQRITRFFEMWP